MSSSTINAFPPLHSFDSSRSWFLAGIVLLHVAFFWALSSGLSLQDLVLPKPAGVIIEIPDAPRQPQRVDPVDVEDPLVPSKIVVAVPTVHIEEQTSAGPRETTTIAVDSSASARTGDVVRPEPKVTSPSLDYSRFSEPVYPASERRAGHEGTVILLVQVLENGRVGEVRVLQSSGYVKLDESALREARVWRFKPGTRDGVAISMWKEIPVKFELKNEVAM